MLHSTSIRPCMSLLDNKLITGYASVMPRKDETLKPKHVIDKIVKRHLAGEGADELAKECKVIRATIYNWVTAYKKALVERSKREGMTPRDAEIADKQTLIAELEQLRLENAKLRDKVVAMMIKAGEI